VDLIQSIQLQTLVVQNYCGVERVRLRMSSSRLKHVYIKGAISPRNFSFLTAEGDSVSRIEHLKIDLIPTATVTQKKLLGMDDVLACSLVELKSLEIIGDRSHKLLLAEEVEEKVDEDKSNVESVVISVQRCMATLLGGLQAPNLSKLVCQVSFFDVEREDLAVKYCDLMLAWIHLHLISLKDFRFSLSWKPGLSFVESCVCVNNVDNETIEAASKVKTIEARTMDSEYKLPLLMKEGVKSEGVGCSFERLKLIWDYSSPSQTRRWLSLLKKQRKLKCLAVGFVHPVMWQCVSDALIQSTEKLVYISLHNLAVWDGRSFSPVDLRIFEACVVLRALHLSLSVFERAVLPSQYEHEPQLMHVLSLPKGLVELSLIRFTLRTDQVISSVVSLPLLKILRLAFLVRDEPEMGITPESFNLIWKMGKLKKVWCKEFVHYVKPIVENLQELLMENEDVTALEELKSSFSKAEGESETFGFSLVNAQASPKNRAIQPLSF
jgi:hypothetical protein